VNSSVDVSKAKRNRLIAIIAGLVVLIAVVLAVVLLSGRSNNRAEDLDASAGTSVGAPDGTGEVDGGAGNDAGTGDDDDGLGHDNGDTGDDAGDAGDNTAGSSQTAVLLTLADITVTGPAGLAPQVTFPTPFFVEDSQVALLEEGNGQLLADGMEVTFHVLVFSGDGEVLMDTWLEEDFAESFVLGEDQDLSVEEEEVEALLRGARVGARVAVIMTDPFGIGGPQDSALLILEVIDVSGGAGNDVAGSLDTPVLLDPADITVSGPAGLAPEVTFPTPFFVEEHQIVLLEDGDGQQLVDGMEVTIHLMVFTSDGEMLLSTWDWGFSESFVLGESTQPEDVELDAVFLGTHVGARLALLVQVSDDGTGEPEDSGLMVIEVIDAR